MEKPKFTPGPWIALEPDSTYAGTPVAAIGDWVVESAVGHLHIGCEEADARLIAAAPELYEALYDIRMSNAGSEQRKRGWKNALAALAKADGSEVSA